MTDKMKFTKGVLLMQTIRNFDNDYLDKVFDGVIDMETFGDMLVVEFIKREYDKVAPTYPLRHFIPYGADANDVRMLYSRVMAYVQRYRDQEYTEMSQRKGIDITILKALKPQQMDTIEQRLEGYKFTEEQFLELTTIHDLQIVKAFVAKRIASTKKVSNAQFRSYMQEYEKWIASIKERQSGSDEDVLFSALAYFTFEWKFSIELIYLMAKQMESTKATAIDKDTLALLCQRLNFDWSFGRNCGCDSRATKERQLLIPFLIKETKDLDIRDISESIRYLDILGLLVVVKNNLPINGQSAEDWFAENTTMEDWASFFRDYKIFDSWHEKELTNAVIRNMRTIFGMIIREPK